MLLDKMLDNMYFKREFNSVLMENHFSLGNFFVYLSCKRQITNKFIYLQIGNISDFGFAIKSNLEVKMRPMNAILSMRPSGERVQILKCIIHAVL